MSRENPKYWGLDGDERLTCTTIEDRLQEMKEERYGDMPESIELVGYDPMVIGEKEIKRYSDWVLDLLLVNIDESEYGFEDYTEETPEMEEAASEFIKKIVSLYEVKSCEIVCRKTVRVADYIDVEKGE